MFLELLQKDPGTYVGILIAVVVSICLHELAHGIVAIRQGDQTPIEQGRMTLNPLVHMGPISLIVLLIAGIAWGSMPIDRTRMRGRYAEAQVAVAGPLMNVLIAVVALAALGLWQRFDHRPADELGQMAANGRFLLWVFGFVNFHLALFNLIPVPPLDGSHILSNFSPAYGRLMEALATGGGIILIFVLLFSVAGRVTSPMAIRAAVGFLEFVRGH